ncbi:unnamed protein product [Adineta ricciae]|uniref:F-box domain-containing protein n=1 Tax=Adineta ricciae TaxID=249248 RepID=A0A814DDP7_ADIRI|nr:unnamed protein product [Adineta ricciae]
MLCFTQLPIVILHRVLNYLDSYDIFYSLYHLNIRLDEILNSYNQHRLDFQSISMSKFDFILERINPGKVISLTLSNMDDTPGQFRLFLKSHSLAQFQHIESLQLLQPSNPIDFNEILLQLQANQTLKSLSILHCPSSAVNPQTFQLLSSFINNSQTLQRLYLSGTLNSLFEHQFTSSINHLYFNDNIFNTISLSTITSRTPHLNSLDTAITHKLQSHPLPFLDHFTRLTLTIFIDMPKFDMENLLKHTPRLVFLKLIANGKQWFNGQFWEQCLPATLKTFQFNFCTQMNNLNEERILDTFQTSFWIDVKHWPVILDYQMNPTMLHLYSLPFCDTQFYYRPSIDSNRQFRSSIPTDRAYMRNVENLTIDLSTLLAETKNLTCDYSLDNSYHYFAKVSTLILTDHECHLSMNLLVKFLESILDFTRVTDLKLGLFHHPQLIHTLYHRMPNLNYLRITYSLLSNLEDLRFQNICSLTICDSLTDIERISLLFPQLQYLCVRLTAFEQIQKAFEHLGRRLRTITFRHMDVDLQGQTLKWLSAYCGEHRRYSYELDQHMDLHIWLGDVRFQQQ